MRIAIICDTFDWTYQEYLAQPKWLIHTRLGKRRIDHEQAEKK